MLTITPDVMNALFEALGGFFVLNHCRVLHDQKEVKGLSVASIAFFTLWGLWNVFYYPTLGQVFSTAAAAFLCATNMLYVGLLIKYSATKEIEIENSNAI